MEYCFSDLNIKGDVKIDPPESDLRGGSESANPLGAVGGGDGRGGGRWLLTQIYPRV